MVVDSLPAASAFGRERLQRSIRVPVRLLLQTPAGWPHSERRGAVEAVGGEVQQAHVVLVIVHRYLSHGRGAATVEHRPDEILDAPPREEPPHAACGFPTNLFAIRCWLVGETLRRRPRPS